MQNQPDTIRRLATLFRRAIEATPKSELPNTFAEFPRGACGDATLLLAKFLEEHDCGAFNYVLGERCEHSHAWLQQGELVVDITADQFEDVPGPVIVEHGSAWHVAFAGERRHVANLETYDTPTRERLRAAYRRIVKRAPEVSE